MAAQADPAVPAALAVDSPISMVVPAHRTLLAWVVVSEEQSPAVLAAVPVAEDLEVAHPEVAVDPVEAAPVGEVLEEAVAAGAVDAAEVAADLEAVADAAGKAVPAAEGFSGSR